MALATTFRCLARHVAWEPARELWTTAEAPQCGVLAKGSVVIARARLHTWPSAAPKRRGGRQPLARMTAAGVSVAENAATGVHKVWQALWARAARPQRPICLPRHLSQRRTTASATGGALAAAPARAAARCHVRCSPAATRTRAAIARPDSAPQARAATTPPTECPPRRVTWQASTPRLPRRDGSRP